MGLSSSKNIEQYKVTVVGLSYEKEYTIREAAMEEWPSMEMRKDSNVLIA